MKSKGVSNEVDDPAIVNIAYEDEGRSIIMFSYVSNIFRPQLLMESLWMTLMNDLIDRSYL